MDTENTRRPTITISDDGFIQITDGYRTTPLGIMNDGILSAYKKGSEPIEVNALHLIQDLRALLVSQLVGNEVCNN